MKGPPKHKLKLISPYALIGTAKEGQSFFSSYQQKSVAGAFSKLGGKGTTEVCYLVRPSINTMEKVVLVTITEKVSEKKEKSSTYLKLRAARTEITELRRTIKNLQKQINKMVDTGNKLQVMAWLPAPGIKEFLEEKP